MRARPFLVASMARLAVVVLAGCTLTEVSIVEVEHVVVAEIYASLAADPAESEVEALLHLTTGAPAERIADLRMARVTVTRADGFAFVMAEAPLDECVVSSPPADVAVCFRADPAAAAALRPGELLEADVLLEDGGRLTGFARAPQSFEIDGMPSTCRLEPNTLLPVGWSRSEGAWAYINETSIRGLPAALQPEGIVVTDDPLYLLGLSVSDDDTTVVFPSEFGLFSRFDLEQDLAVRLQVGLPAATVSEVTISAVGPNYVNWVRGGNFNPSGQVRVPSLRGDGTGVFAVSVVRRFVVVSDDDPGSFPRCPVP